MVGTLRDEIEDIEADDEEDALRSYWAYGSDVFPGQHERAAYLAGFLAGRKC